MNNVDKFILVVSMSQYIYLVEHLYNPMSSYSSCSEKDMIVLAHDEQIDIQRKNFHTVLQMVVFNKV